MLFIGIDPGKHGGIAMLDSSGAQVREMPTVLLGREEYDLREIAVLLWSWRNSRARGALVTVERLQPMPAKLGGGIANFARGAAMGWEWALTAMEIPYQLVSPQTWQKAMLAGTPAGDTKKRSIIAAHRLFPGVSLQPTPRCRKDHDGLADALLIAEYGRRMHA